MVPQRQIKDSFPLKNDQHNNLHITEDKVEHDEKANDEYTKQFNQIRNQITQLTSNATKNKDVATENSDVELRHKPGKVVRRSTAPKQNDSSHRRSLDFAQGLVNDDDLIGSNDLDDVTSTSSTPPPLPVSRPPTIVSTIFKADIDPHNETQIKRKSLKNVQFRSEESVNSDEFKPIQLLHSNENLAVAVIKPIPRYPSISKSTQDLSTYVNESEFGFGPMNFSRSSDDLLLPDVDGLRRSMRSHRRWRMRSLENMSSIDDPVEMETIDKKSVNDRPVLVAATRKPLPLPRNNDRDSIKFVYVFDEQRKEFVQENSEHGEIPLNKVTVSLSNPNLSELSSIREDSLASTDTKSKRKFAFFGLGQKKLVKPKFGSQQQLPTVMDESHPLYRIRSMEDMVEHESAEKRNSVASVKSVFYVPHPIAPTKAQQPIKMCKYRGSLSVLVPVLTSCCCSA